MSTDAVRDALHKQPFQPFLIQLADGRAFFVAHPDFVAVAPRTVIVVSPVDGTVSWVKPLLIVSIEFVGSAKTAPAPDSNGA
jgi:hypothetical protein